MIGIEVVGTELGEVRFPIERGKVAELARACGDDGPHAHLALAVARQSGEAVLQASAVVLTASS